MVFRQVLINNWKLYIFFSFVLLTDDDHFVFSSKIFRKRALQSPRFQHKIAIWHQFVWILRSCHKCSQCEIMVWSPKAFESSNRGSIMPMRLNRTRDLTNRGITGPYCITPHSVTNTSYCLKKFLQSTACFVFKIHITGMVIYINHTY